MMKIYLVSNNLLLDRINYGKDTNLEVVRMIRPLDIKGYSIAEHIAKMDLFNDIENIYSSFYSSALSTASFISKKLEIEVFLDSNLNECRVGTLGSKNMKMVKGLQDHDFTYKLPNGESLIEVGKRIKNVVEDIIKSNENSLVFTHKRAILGFLTNYAKVGYNLDDNLILEFNGKIIYDDSDTDYDIYELVIEDNEIVDINYL